MGIILLVFLSLILWNSARNEAQYLASIHSLPSPVPATCYLFTHILLFPERVTKRTINCTTWIGVVCGQYKIDKTVPVGIPSNRMLESKFFFFKDRIWMKEISISVHSDTAEGKNIIWLEQATVLTFSSIIDSFSLEWISLKFALIISHCKVH